MALQRDLATIEEYNAAMELPYAGLVGIGAYGAKSTSRNVSVARAEISACIELCKLGEGALKGDLKVARQNVYFFSAWRRVGEDPAERDRLRRDLAEIREALEEALIHLSHKGSHEPLKRAIRQQLVAKLRALSERIRQAIPREASLGSLIGSQSPFARRNP